MVKATRDWAPESEQGRAFGFLECGRGVCEGLSSTLILSLFAWLGSDQLAFRWVILAFSFLNILLAFFAWQILGFSGPERESRKSHALAPEMGGITEMLQNPVVWAIAFIVMTAYIGYWGTFYFTPYVSDIYSRSAVFGGSVGVGKMWIKLVIAVVAGIVADRIGPGKAVSGLFVVMSLSYALFAFLPASGMVLPVVLVNMTIASVTVFSLRGIYFSLLEESKIPDNRTGVVVGIVSMIGFFPDIFMPLFAGVLMDYDSGKVAYDYLFITIALASFAGLITSVMLRIHNQRSVKDSRAMSRSKNLFGV